MLTLNGWGDSGRWWSYYILVMTYADGGGLPAVGSATGAGSGPSDSARGALLPLW